jgi:Tol biopolymer transport system component
MSGRTPGLSDEEVSMRGKIRFLGLVMVLALAAAICVIGMPGWAQKSKPQPPPTPAPNPAIVYSAWYAGGTAEDHKDLMVMNADGSNNVALVSKKGVHNTRPDWSPDGKQIVFVDNALGPTNINIINVNGTGQKRILELRNSWGPVAWSPVPLGDGKYKIAFCHKALLPDGTLKGDNDLFLVNLDGTGEVQLTDTPDIDEGYWSDGQIAWSPLGNMIAVSTPEDIIISRIDYVDGRFSATSLGGIQRVPGSPIANALEVFDVDWANTQNMVVVATSPSETATYDLWIVDVFNPINVYRVTSTPLNYERECSWSPTDAQIAYIQGPSSGIWVINADGTGAKEILKPVKRVSYERPQWRRNL